MQPLFWQRHVGSLIATARRRIKQVLWSRLRPFGLTPQQFAVIATLDEETTVAGVELAQHLCIDAPTTCRVVDNLVRRGLLRAEADPEDRRRFRLRMTPAGKKLANQVRGLRDSLSAEIERGFSAAELTTMRSGLLKVIDNMERLAEGEAEGVERVSKPRAKPSARRPVRTRARVAGGRR